MVVCANAAPEISRIERSRSRVRRVGRVRFIIIPFKDLLESTDSGADSWATTVPKLTFGDEVPVKLFKPRRDWLFDDVSDRKVQRRISAGVHELV